MDANAARGHYRTLRTDQNHEIAAEKIDAGDSYTTAGLYPKAIEQYNTALGLDPRSADAYVGRGTALYHLDKLEEAARDFRTALRVEEQHPKAGGFLETVLSRLRARKVEVESAYRGEYLMPMEDDSSSNTKRGGPKSTVGGGGFYDTMSVSERVHVHGDEAMERERERERERENERGGGKSKKEKSSKKKSGKRKKKKSLGRSAGAVRLRARTTRGTAATSQTAAAANTATAPIGLDGTRLATTIAIASTSGDGCER
ncbi:hypothetical protein BJ742DRAFT_35353 [Cladochytrium replicatum]|nr:hypothetical protein BJ742DRAFT_35353 [Cladochytrium replicatum]